MRVPKREGDDQLQYPVEKIGHSTQIKKRNWRYFVNKKRKMIQELGDEVSERRV